MSRLLLHMAAWLALSLAFPAPAAAHLAMVPPGLSGPCVCALARQHHGWCPKCNRGYVAQIAVPSRALYEMLDPHGHDIDVTKTPCAQCRAAWASEGYCEKDAIGFAGGRAYVSRLAYLLARGEPLQSAAVQAEVSRLRTALLLVDRCELCAVASFVNGRCPQCKVYYRDGRPMAAAVAQAAASPVPGAQRGAP